MGENVGHSPARDGTLLSAEDGASVAEELDVDGKLEPGGYRPRSVVSTGLRQHESEAVRDWCKYCGGFWMV